MKLLAQDPGKTTGFAVFHYDENDPKECWLEQFGEVKDTEIFDFLNNFQYDFYVIENYRIRTQKKDRGFAHDWVSPFALEVIGATKLRALQVEAGFKLQEPSIKPVGYGFAGIPYKKGASKVHHKDAIAHGAYYLVKNNLLKPGELRGRSQA